MNLMMWKNAFAAVQGVDHIADNKPCQDATSSLHKNGVYAIALADGAGSRKASEHGSSILTKAITEALVQHFDQYYLMMESEDTINNGLPYKSLRDELIRIGRSALNQFLHKNNEWVYADLASTLLFYAFKEDRYIMGHLGDGLIVGLFQGMTQEYMRVLSAPDNGLEANITFFFTESDVDDHFRLHKGLVRNLMGVILMSDGPEEVLYSKEEGLHDNTFKLFSNFKGINQREYGQAIEKLLKENIANFSYDDLSLNVLYLDQFQLDENKKSTQDILSKVQYVEQIIQVSRVNFLIDLSRYGKRQLSNAQSAMTYLRSQT